MREPHSIRAYRPSRCVPSHDDLAPAPAPAQPPVKLTPEIRNRIRELHSEGNTVRQICDKLRVSYIQAWRTVKRSCA